MQTQGGVEAEDAILASERRVYVEIKADWDRDGSYDHYLTDLSPYVDQITVDRSLAGSIPENIMLIEGGAAAELSFVVGGKHFEGRSWLSELSPYNGTSLLYQGGMMGVEVTYRIGIETAIGIAWYSQFVGRIRTVQPNRATGEVTVTALDRVEVLRNPVRFPLWAIADYQAQRGWTLAQLAESHWVIDHCLRFGDTSASPYRPMYETEFTPTVADVDTGVRFFLTGNGAHTPTVGQMDDAQVQGFPESEFGGAYMYDFGGNPHPLSPEPTKPPMGLAAMANDTTGMQPTGERTVAELRYWAVSREVANTFSTHWMGFSLNTTGIDGNWFRITGNTTTVFECYLGSHLKAMITLLNGSIRVELRNHQTLGGFVTPWYAVPVADHIQVDVKVQPADPPKAMMWMNHVAFGPVTLGASAPYDNSFDDLSGQVEVRHHAAISDVYWSTRFATNTITFEDAGAYARKPAKYAAVLDPGLNMLTHLPGDIYEDSWQVITDVAEAELGAVFWDEDGVFHFWNRDTIVAKQSTTVRTLDIDSVSGLQITNSLDSVRNVVTADGHYAVSGRAVVFAADQIDQFYIAPGQTKYFTVFLTDVQQVLPNKLPRYNSVGAGGWTADGLYQGYVVQYLQSGVWVEDTGAVSGVDVVCWLDKENNMIIRVFNGYSWAARFATDGGEAALRVVGSKITKSDQAVAYVYDKPSINKYGRRNLVVSGDWVQYQPDVVTLAVEHSLLDYLLPRTIIPIPMTDAITVSGDPRLQLGDCMIIQDSDGLGESMKVQIYGINRSFSREAGIVDTLTVELLEPPQIGIWNSAQYGLWDQSFYWSA